MRRFTSPALIVVCVGLAACGGDDDGADDAGARFCAGLDQVDAAAVTGDEAGMRNVSKPCSKPSTTATTPNSAGWSTISDRPTATQRSLPRSSTWPITANSSAQQRLRTGPRVGGCRMRAMDPSPGYAWARLGSSPRRTQRAVTGDCRVRERVRRP
jgi:hypothetical protein